MFHSLDRTALKNIIRIYADARELALEFSNDLSLIIDSF